MFTHTEARLNGNLLYTIENHDARGLVAFSYEGFCSSNHHPFGHADAALSDAQPLKQGMSNGQQTFPDGCELKVTSAVFEDGSTYGSQSEIELVKKRRLIAYKLLHNFYEEVVRANKSPKGVDPNILLLDIASLRSALPSYSETNKDEVLAKTEVLFELETETTILRDRIEQKIGDRRINVDLYLDYVRTWLRALSGDHYPKFRPSMPVGR
jgi:hypothetical protein